MKTLNYIIKTACEVMAILMIFLGIGVFGAWENNSLNFIQTFLVSGLIFSLSALFVYLSMQFKTKKRVVYRKTINHKDNTIKFAPKVA